MTAFGSAMFPKPNSLENENYKNPFLMTDKKKTYIAWQMSPKPNGWNLTGKDAPQLGIKGFVFKKRSKCGFAQDIGLDLAKKIMSGKDFTIPDMRLWLKEELKKIPTGNIKTIDELNNFIITCSLNSDYKSTENLALHLADSIESFSGARPRVGTRLPFLVAYMPQQRLHFKTCITPDYFLSDSNLVIDIEYYVTKQISKCLEQILCLPVHQSLCFALQEVMDDFVLTWGLRQTKQNEMGVFFTSNSAETAPLDQTEQNRKKRLRENNEIFKKFRKPVVLTKKPKK
jgi:DNA polymerase elongation subunit (family B)